MNLRQSLEEGHQYLIYDTDQDRAIVVLSMPQTHGMEDRERSDIEVDENHATIWEMILCMNSNLVLLDVPVEGDLPINQRLPGKGLVDKTLEYHGYYKPEELDTSSLYQNRLEYRGDQEDYFS